MDGAERRLPSYDKPINFFYIEGLSMEKIIAISRELKRYKEQIALQKLHEKQLTNIKYLLSTPFIYGMIVPMLFFHILIEIYHRVCFYLYDMEYIDYRNHFRFDRHRIGGISPLQKFNCIYCEYGNGLASFTKEVIGKTEAFWCPIKHEDSPESPHAYYQQFMEYGNGRNFEEKRETVREKLS